MHCRLHSFVAITLAVCLGVSLSSLGAQNSEPRPVRRPPAAAAERTMTVKGRHVTLEFRQSDFNLLKNPKDLTDFLDSVYEKMQELTFHSPTMSLRGQRNLDAWGTADENGIEIDWTCVPPLMKGFNTGTIEFGVIHEMGHVFDARNFGRWYITPICGGETLGNIKLSYAVDSLLRRDNQYRIEFGPGDGQTGYDFNNNFYLNAGKEYLASDTSWDKMDVDDLHSFHMTLIRRYGWDVYKKWFRAYYLIEAQKDGRAPSSCNDPVRINMVCALLSSFSGENLAPDFQEWRMPVTNKTVSEVVKRYQLTEVCAAVEKQFAREYAEGRISLDPLSLRVTVETVSNKPEAKVGFFSALKADGAIIRYTLAELKDLVRFADERGVTIIPEFEMPGHSSQLSVAFTDVFCDSQGCVINFLNPGAMPILTDLVNEMCDVFQSSPYFHMGSDECNWDLFEKRPNVVEDRKINKRGTSQQHGWLINEINKVVKKRGKSLIVWEGFDGPDAGVDKDVIVMEWDGRFFPPYDVAAAGYKMISVPWVPAIWATARECYEWNTWLLGSQDRTPDRFKRGTPEADLVIGGMMQLWECGGDSALPQLRSTAVPRHERIHSPDAGKTYEDFDRRFRSTDQILDLLVHKFVVRTDGLVNYGDTVFKKSLVLTVEPSPSLKNAVFRYTLENALDGKMPSYPGDGKKPGPDSPVYTAPIRITESTQFNVQAFDANGKELGFPRLTKYMLRPLSGTMKGLLPQERYRQNRYSCR